MNGMNFRVHMKKYILIYTNNLESTEEKKGRVLKSQDS